ncbi:YhcN/YlaJ family sporulation lipoprotein [Shimazuella sp. AN120528]|uniref:YhcN/YlaJ family sporulation lipoprotein n=1 Tax=Shimazuella soli TaxID=1892854 RepID=UPI001F0D7F3F|nr:YhcN/YlaJ family sporulation lipoprotein [Shimazuella soli]MCH5584017.1 YhcN/YlaJ family sporulation lipoprotein [Shimazuella soli]
MVAFIRLIGIFSLTAGLLFGCAPQKSAPNKVTPKTQKISYTQRVKQTVPVPQYNKSSRNVSNRLEQIAKHVPHVKDATAVSVGKYSIVGLDLDANLDRGRVGTVKYSVAEALHKDPVGAKALVTADVDLVQRIKNVAKDIRQGKPISGTLKELAAIAERIAPQPTKVVPKK